MAAPVVGAAPRLTIAKRVGMRLTALEQERARFVPFWQDISEHQQPAAGRFLWTDGKRQAPPSYNQILDNTALQAARVLGSGLMSGATSPARQWFRLGLRDQRLAELASVKVWLFKSGMLLRDVFQRSNTYLALQQGYQELGLFGTWAAVVEPNFETVIHMHPMTIGQYVLGTNSLGMVDTFGRKLQMTVAQLVERFGYDACSTTVRGMWDRFGYDKAVPVSHLIQPRRDRNPRQLDVRNMRFESLYIEGGSDNEDQALEISGHRRFPVLGPRWSVAGNDIWGTSPGMEVQGDVRQLQVEQLRKGQAIDYMVNPPLQVPVAYKESSRSRMPGGLMYVDMIGTSGGVRSAYDVQLELQPLLLDIQDVRERIRAGYYADLFLMLANDTRSGTTATEIAERHEEKLLMIGPVLERLQNELYTPLIDITFDACLEAGILPPIPPELEGQEINVEFVSSLAQAQRAVSAQGVDRWLGTIGQLAAVKQDPSLWDKVDADKVIDDYADSFGVNPEYLVPDDVVAQQRADKARQAAAMQAAASVPALAGAAKDLGDTNGANVADVINQFSGYTTPA